LMMSDSQGTNLESNAACPLVGILLFCYLASIFLLGNIAGSPRPGQRKYQFQWSHGWPAYYLERTGVTLEKRGWEITSIFPWGSAAIRRCRPLAIPLNAAIAVLACLGLLFTASATGGLRNRSGLDTAACVQTLAVILYLSYSLLVEYSNASILVPIFGLAVPLYIAAVAVAKRIATPGNKRRTLQFGLAGLLLFAYGVVPLACVVLKLGPTLLKEQAAVSGVPPYLGVVTLVSVAALAGTKVAASSLWHPSKARGSCQGTIRLCEMSLAIFCLCIIALATWSCYEGSWLANADGRGALKYILLAFMWFLLFHGHTGIRAHRPAVPTTQMSRRFVAIGIALVLLGGVEIGRLFVHRPPSHVSLFSDEIGVFGGCCLLWLAQDASGDGSCFLKNLRVTLVLRRTDCSGTFSGKAAVLLRSLLTVTSVGALSGCVVSTAGGDGALALGVVLVWLPIGVAARWLVGPFYAGLASIIIGFAAGTVGVFATHLLEAETSTGPGTWLAILTASVGFAAVGCCGSESVTV
jgi:hypothetical protein